MARTGRLLLAASAAILGLAGSIYLSYSNELRRARSSVSHGLTVTMATGPMEYAVHDSGAPLLSIHGAGGGYDQGLSNAADLVGDGFRVIAPSRFGYLGTPIPADPSAAAQADVHAALLAKLGVSKAVVVGISAGALSAIELAIRHPDRVSALILIVPASYAPADSVSIEASRGSKFAFWLVNNGADFVWWAAEKIAPSVLIRFIGVPPELLASASEAEQARAMRFVRDIAPLSRRFAGSTWTAIRACTPCRWRKLQCRH